MSVRFNASGDYLRRTENLPSTTNFTMCGWCRIINLRGAWQYIAGLEDKTTSAAYWSLIGYTNGNVLHIAADNGGLGVYYNFTRQPTENEWFFFAISRTGNAEGNFKGYLARATDETLEVIQNSATITSFTPENMQFMNNSFSEWVDGELAHVRVWDAVLTQEQIEVEWKSAVVVRTSNINLVYRLSTATDTNDIGGNGYNPTIGGTLADGSGDPPVGSGLDVNTIKLKMKLYNAKLSNIRV